MREVKSTYGSGILYTGIRMYKDYRYAAKEDAEITEESDVLNPRNFDKIEHKTWFLFPKSIHVKDFYIDDAAVGQPDVQIADDCIMKEKISMMEFQVKYGDSKVFKNLDLVVPYVDWQPKNKDDNTVDLRQIIVYHYFHRITKKYMIVVNETAVIYNGIYLYDDGKLPFVNVQHYSNINRFWGEGIPERVAYLKSYKSEIFQDILSGAQMSSGLHMIVGNDDAVDQDWTIGGRQVNLWRTTGGAE